jgi:hypothetical protein
MTIRIAMQEKGFSVVALEEKGLEVSHAPTTGESSPG